MTRADSTSRARTPEQTRLVELAASVGFVIAIVLVALWTRVMHTNTPAPATGPTSSPAAASSSSPAHAAAALEASHAR